MDFAGIGGSGRSAPNPPHHPPGECALHTMTPGLTRARGWRPPTERSREHHGAEPVPRPRCSQVRQRGIGGAGKVSMPQRHRTPASCPALCPHTRHAAAGARARPPHTASDGSLGLAGAASPSGGTPHECGLLSLPVIGGPPYTWLQGIMAPIDVCQGTALALRSQG